MLADVGQHARTWIVRSGPAVVATVAVVAAVVERAARE
jgi:hypothetical protein